MRRRFTLLLVLLAACGPHRDAGLEAARADLQAALATRDPATVGAAARSASAYEGQDPHLDHLLGDALANVLMRTADGIALLRAHPAPDDPSWVRAYESASLRTGESAALDATLSETGSPASTAPEALVAWMGARALRDPTLDIDAFRAASAACALWDGQPSRGRRTVDQPTPPGFLEALPGLGAEAVVLGRAFVPPDPAPHTGEGLQPCTRGRIWPTAAWPEPLPKHVTVAIRTATKPLYLSVRPEAGEPWVFASTRSDVAGELVAAVRAVQGGTVLSSTWLPDRLSETPDQIVPPLAD